jgi:hypothetical protein
MDASQIISMVFQVTLTLVVGLIGWSVKNTVGPIKENIKKNADNLEKQDAKQTAAVEKVQSQLNDLKSDLPFVYVTREDYIRTMNNVDKQMTIMDGKLDRLLSKGCKEE